MVYAELLDHTVVSPGGSVCDPCTVWIEVPNGVLIGLQSSSDGVHWAGTGFRQIRSYVNGGITWTVFCSDTWLTVGWKNQPVTWLFSYMTYGMPPGFNQAQATWTPYNTVVHAPDTTIRYDPDSTDPTLTSATVTWYIDHLNWNPTWAVTVLIKDLGGNTVRTIQPNPLTAGLGSGSATWDGSVDGGAQGQKAPKGVYFYQVSAWHEWSAWYMSVGCTDMAFVDQLVQSPQLDNFTLYADLKKVAFQIKYSLPQGVGSCWAEVFDPNLSLCYAASGLPNTAGQHETDPIWVDAVEGTPEGNPLRCDTAYYLVVHATETNAAGAIHRDGQPKDSVPRAAKASYAVAAVAWRDVAGAAGFDQAAASIGSAGYSLASNAVPCPDMANALGPLPSGVGLRNAAIWFAFQHSDEGWQYVSPNVMFYLFGQGGGGHIMDYDSPTPQAPPGYNPSNDLNVRDYSGNWRQLLFVAYVACFSGVTDPHGDLLAATVNAGARSALGFTETIYGDGSTSVAGTLWCMKFWSFACTPGVTVESAANSAACAVFAVYGTDDGWLSYRLTDPGLMLTPARYGW